MTFDHRKKLELVKIFLEKGYYFPYKEKDFTYEFCVDVKKGEKKVIEIIYQYIIYITGFS